jgi:hypothetical protein
VGGGIDAGIKGGDHSIEIVSLKPVRVFVQPCCPMAYAILDVKPRADDHQLVGPTSRVVGNVN